MICNVLRRKEATIRNKTIAKILWNISIYYENKVTGVLFQSQNNKYVLLVNPDKVDLCFMLEAIDDFRRKVDALRDLKKQFQRPQFWQWKIWQRILCHLLPRLLCRCNCLFSWQHIVRSQEPRHGSQVKPKPADLPSVRMQHGYGLRVALPLSQRASISNLKQESRKQPVIGSSNNDM